MKSGLRFLLNSDEHQLKSLFDRLLSIFQELLLASSGNIAGSLEWMNELNSRYKIFNESYGLPDFIQELKNKKLIELIDSHQDSYKPSSKLELAIRKNAFETLFRNLRKNRTGMHKTKYSGTGDNQTESHRPFEFGDLFHQIICLHLYKKRRVS